jgi:hypothetical protein
VGKASDATSQAGPEALDQPQGRGKGGQHVETGRRVGTRRLAAAPQTRVDTGDPAAPSVDPGRPTSPEHFDLPTVDPMADLAGLAERSLRESLESLRSVSESRTLSELLERQSRHMRLITEIWMRQAERNMEVFNAMLSQRRE